MTERSCGNCGTMNFDSATHCYNCLEPLTPSAASYNPAHGGYPGDVPPPSAEPLYPYPYDAIGKHPPVAPARIKLHTVPTGIGRIDGLRFEDWPVL